ncbi:MAG: hypothetical protein CM15mP120_24750 [Pseudomonadota bacterium]|nr:MAG: hypothetical protein CM15mP120_24750 [Pseudomonadota bacterium]
MIKTVCHYAHEAMFKISGDNNSRMSLMPLATIRLTPPQKKTHCDGPACVAYGCLAAAQPLHQGSAVTDVEFIVQGSYFTLADEKPPCSFPGNKIRMTM